MVTSCSHEHTIDGEGTEETLKEQQEKLWKTLTPQSLHTMRSRLTPFLLMNSRGCHHPIEKEKDLMVLPTPPCPLPAFCLWENLAKDKFNQKSEKMQKRRETVK